ncbi:MAG: hypothetical protein PUK66_02830 [Bacteroidales bacterium]|uniref:hypothetical protein n=1 Tax=Porphyromonas sp. TaxID=1924944 RepID=UPI002976383A|nr:hypothetical protein [Porphyromonas sp.]MDD7437757.1 hypothetical protein [Bacteroidales bacterium]MDY3067264.1 hypothetical protein [Porphyromonas sp.]
MSDIFVPSILTLITTYKCTASCCFGCNPKRDITMSERDMISYIDTCMTSYPEIDKLSSDIAQSLVNIEAIDEQDVLSMTGIIEDSIVESISD